MIKDPLKTLFKKYNFNTDKIKEIVTGKKYTAVCLKNGNIGVCANLGNTISPKLASYKDLELDIEAERIVYNAYLNAICNYEHNLEGNKDIWDILDFKKFPKIVMCGYFKPIVNKFERENIPLSIFDLTEKSKKLLPLEKQKEYLENADAIILTSTSIFNKTYPNVMNSIKKDCKVFLLGPSSIMTKELLIENTIIFGSVFKKNDHRVLDVIKNDLGTRQFLKFGKKCMFKLEK